jgi:putative ABC transport system permease protein
MPPEPLRAELRRRLAADHVRISGYRDAQPQLKQFLEQLARYLGLIGLTALFIGGLGVAMSIHAFMQEKMKTIAILKTLGADSAVLIKVYVVQAIGLGLIGSGVGIVLGILLQRWLPPLLAGAFVSDLLDQLGVSAELSFVSIGPLLKGGAMGCGRYCECVRSRLLPFFGERWREASPTNTTAAAGGGFDGA